MPTDLSPRAVLARLLAFPTVSSATNLPLIDFAADLLPRSGAELLRIPDPTGEKASLVARIGPDMPGGVVLSAHSDAVQSHERGLSAAICGPGDIAQAHGPDEWISRDQFEAGGRFVRGLIDRLAA